MDLQEIFSEAVKHHTLGDLQKAKQKYLEILKELPENSKVLGNLGIVCRDIGEIEEAISYCRKAVSFSHDDPSQMLNLGAVYEAAGNLQEAREVYTEILQKAPEEPRALNNLGKTLHLLGDSDGGLQFLQKAIALAPHYPLALNNIGVILSERGDIESALRYLEKSRELDPDNADSLYNLAGVYNILGRTSDSIETLEKVIMLNPEHLSAKHMHSALKGEVTDTAPHQYVVETFDRYASRFESHIQKKLGYDSPQALGILLRQYQPDTMYENCLDIGCGTGLSGIPFRDRCRNMTGVDLSPQMLKKAEEKNIYNDLICGDVYEYLDNTRPQVDLVISADVFVYLGRLDIFFIKLDGCVMPGGILCCSIERYEVNGEFTLRTSGRYAHSVEYFRRISSENGYCVLGQVEHNIRKENDVWIPGNLFLLKKC